MPAIAALTLTASAQQGSRPDDVWPVSPMGATVAAEPVSAAAAIRFTPNRGQVVDTRGQLRPDVRFTAGSGGMRIFFRDDAISYVFTRTVDGPARSDDDGLGARRSRIGARAMEVSGAKLVMHRLDMQLVGANPAAEVVAEAPTGDYANFYYRHCPDGITGVPAYGRLVYRNIYPNIDLVLHSEKDHLKYDFVVHPGGRVGDIAWRYAGSDGAGVTPRGTITARTPLGDLNEAAPFAYQRDRRGVNCGYTADDGLFGFAVPAYDASVDLVIDPTVIWATYLGGTGIDAGSGNAGIAVDASGDIGAIGATASVDFPVTAGAVQGNNNGANDMFIMKMRSSGAMVWCTYMGGPNNDAGKAIAVDTLGRYAFVGIAPDEFPTANAFQSLLGGSVDAVIGFLDSTGRRRWVTYFGGSLGDFAEDVTFDSQGDIVVVGETGSSNFPTINPWQGSLAGQDDGFIAKFKPSGLLSWSSYYGGSKIENFAGVAVNPDRTIVVGGLSESPNFPIFGTPFQATPNGIRVDACVMKLSSSGTPQWSTFYGGGTNTTGRAVAIDPKGNVYLGGIISFETGPSTPVLPTTPTSFQQNYRGGGDGFLAKFDRVGTHLWSTYYGGSDTDFVKSVATTSIGDVFISGGTRSANFPVTGTAYQGALRGSYDAHVVQFDSNGARRWATYYGGGGDDQGYDMVFGVASVYIIGHTASTNLLGTATGFQPASAGGDEAFIVRFNGFCPIPVPKVQTSGVLTFCEGDSVVLTAAGGYQQYRWTPGNATTQKLVVKTSGTYSVTVTDGDICTATSNTIKVLVHKAPVAKIAPAGIIGICQGDSLRLDAFHDDIVTYKWSNGDSLARIWVKDSGVYTVRVIDTAGCTNTSLSVTVKLTQRPAKPVIAPSDTVWVCTDSVFFLDAGPGYTNYTWFPSRKTGQRLRVDSAGTYAVQVNNIPGCESISDSVTVMFYPRIPVSLGVGSIQQVCQGDSLVLQVPAGRFSSPRWSTGDTTARIAAKSNGLYYVTVTDSNGCRVRSDSVRVTMRPTPLAEITGPVSVCGNASPIYSTRTVGTLVYQWSITGDGTIQGASDTRSITVQWGASGAGRLTLQVTDTSTGCGSTGSVDVVIGTSLKPVVTPSGTITLCQGDSVELDAGAGYDSYAWSNGAVTRTIWVKDSLGYAVTVVDASGCRGTSDTVRATIEVPPVPVIDGPAKVCRATTVNYSSRDASGTDYQWSATGGTVTGGQGTANATVQWGAGPTGTVTVVMTSAAGCKSTATVPVEIGSELKPAVTPGGSLTLCAGDSIELDAGGGYTSYLWSTGATSQRITIKSGGSYTVTVSDASGCGGTSDAVVVTQAARPVAAITPGGTVRLNPGDTLVLDAGAGFAAYRWSINGAANPVTSRTLTARDTGTYAVQVTDANGCTGVASVRVDRNSALAEVALGAIQASPGMRVELPLELVSSQDLAGSGATSYEATLRYHGSLLVPTGRTPQGRMDGTDRVVTVTGTLPAGMTVGELQRIEFIAALGEMTSGVIKLESVNWKGTGGDTRSIATILHDGSITTTGLCTNGGARLVLANGSQGLKAVIPNPASESVTIVYDLVEEGRCRMTITDVLGREVSEVFTGDRTNGEYAVQYDASPLTTGLYIVVLETPTGRVNTMMRVMR